jgi:hypothetical protein
MASDSMLLCGVCFSEISARDNPQGCINSCAHAFCAFCISQWAKETNVCPQCRARFTRISVKDATTGEITVTKVRRRNYKAWEETSSDEDDDDELAEARRASRAVSCALCGLQENAAGMICCDRRSCVFVAHLSCLGLDEAPAAFVCQSCSLDGEQRSPTRAGLGPAAIAGPSASAPAAANATAANWPSASSHAPPAAHAAVVKTEEGSSGLQPAAQREAPAAVRPALPQWPREDNLNQDEAPGRQADANNELPYWLQPAEHVQLSIDELRRRKDHAALVRHVRQEHRQDLQSNRTAKRPRSPPRADCAQQLFCSEEQLIAKERSIAAAEFPAVLNVLRQRQAAESASLRLGRDGVILPQRPVTPGERQAKEDALRRRAQQVADEIAAKEMRLVRAAHLDAAERMAQRRAMREALGLAKLAHLISQRKRGVVTVAAVSKADMEPKKEEGK